MAKTATATFGSGDDWEKIVAIAGALVAFRVFPKKWGLPLSFVALILAFRNQ
jgi:hypothetical protein